MSHALQGHPRWMGHSEEFWWNVVHWRRKWKPTPVFLPEEPHGQFEKVKRYDAGRWGPPTQGLNSVLPHCRQSLYRLSHQEDYKTFFLELSCFLYDPMTADNLISGCLSFLPPVDHILSELSTMTPLSWVALHSMAHSFIELCKPLGHDKAVIHEGQGGLMCCSPWGREESMTERLNNSNILRLREVA